MSSSEKLLKLFSKFADRSEPWTVDELSRELDLAQSTTYRHLKSLADAGLVVAETAGSYILGPAVIMLDRQMRLSDPLIRGSCATVERLHRELKIPGVILVCRLFRDSVMCVDSRQVGEPTIQVSYERGRPLPLQRGAGSKAILAHMSLRSIKGYYDADPKSFSQSNIGEDWSEVKRYLRSIRRAGFIVTNSEVDKDVLGFASPILDQNGLAIGSLGFVAAVDDAGEPIQKNLSEALRAGAAEIQEKIRVREA